MRRNEPVSKIMTASPITVHSGQPLSEVQALMSEHRCHHMPVVSGPDLVGMVSSTDLLRVTYAWGQDSRNAEAVLDHTHKIEDVMQPGLVTISPKTTIREAAGIFAKNWFHALPVVEGGKLVGIITTTDLLNYLLDQY
ncbi:MAG: CBS domain-containing protein [Alphaproteobacteria bacterium]|nr:CBS domain-containing protein [Alphaproteobacteria bacterium]